MGVAAKTVKLHLSITSIREGRVNVTVLIDGNSCGRLVLNPRRYEAVAALMVNADAAEITATADPLPKQDDE